MDKTFPIRFQHIAVSRETSFTLLNDTGEFFNHDEIRNKYNVKCDFLSCLMIRKSIPIH